MLDPCVPTSLYSASAFCNLRAFDVHEVSINFDSSAHQGDKRKTSQQCNLTLFIHVHCKCQLTNIDHASTWTLLTLLNISVTGSFGSWGLFATCGQHRTVEFGKSKAMLGSINAVPRSRVNELQNPEEDRPLAPHWRVLFSVPSFVSS
jgi:hypothetical protein